MTRRLRYVAQSCPCDAPFISGLRVHDECIPMACARAYASIPARRKWKDEAKGFVVRGFGGPMLCAGWLDGETDDPRAPKMVRAPRTRPRTPGQDPSHVLVKIHHTPLSRSITLNCAVSCACPSYRQSVVDEAHRTHALRASSRGCSTARLSPDCRPPAPTPPHSRAPP